VCKYTHIPKAKKYIRFEIILFYRDSEADDFPGLSIADLVTPLGLHAPRKPGAALQYRFSGEAGFCADVVVVRAGLRR